MRITNLDNGETYEFGNSREYCVDLFDKLDWTKELDQACENSDISFKLYIESDLVSLDDVMKSVHHEDGSVNLRDNVKEDVIKFIKENNFEGYQANIKGAK